MGSFTLNADGAQKQQGIFHVAAAFQHRNWDLYLQDDEVSEISITGRPTKMPVSWGGKIRSENASTGKTELLV